MPTLSPFKLLSPRSGKQTSHPLHRKPQNTRSVDELASLIGRGERADFLFFWGHTPKVRGVLDQSCFSNWFPAAFTIGGITYPSTEHHMMAEKARLFGDMQTRLQILATGSPGTAKSLGRKVMGFNEASWAMHRFEIVVAGNEAKFAQNPDMARLLLCTGSKVLVEASPVDNIWGIGLGKEHENAENPRLWKGLNLLGFALMEVRARLGVSQAPQASPSFPPAETSMRRTEAFGYAEAGENRIF